MLEETRIIPCLLVQRSYRSCWFIRLPSAPLFSFFLPVVSSTRNHLLIPLHIFTRCFRRSSCLWQNILFLLSLLITSSCLILQFSTPDSPPININCSFHSSSWRICFYSHTSCCISFFCLVILQLSLVSLTFKISTSALFVLLTSLDLCDYIRFVSSLSMVLICWPFPSLNSPLVSLSLYSFSRTYFFYLLSFPVLYIQNFNSHVYFCWIFSNSILTSFEIRHYWW